jgi:hypothetical protein
MQSQMEGLSGGGNFLYQFLEKFHLIEVHILLGCAFLGFPVQQSNFVD